MTFLKIICLAILLIVGWHLIVLLFHLPDYLLPSPYKVWEVFIHSHTLILRETIPTVYETLLGLLLGILLGSIAAIVMSYSRLLAAWFLPTLIISQAIPTFAIAPLLVMWLGFGMASKIATTVLMLFFPITSSFYDGLNRTNRHWLELAKTMQAKKWRTFLHIRLPAALPTAASGLRIAAVFAPIGAIIGEWVGASEGLGFLMLNANARMQIDLMFAALLMIILLSLTLYFTTDYLLRKFIWWQN